MQKSLKNRYFQNKHFGLELWFSLTWLKPLMISLNCLNTSSHACSQVFINLLPSPGTLARGILTGPHGDLVFPSLHPWLLGKGDEWFNVMFGHLCPPCWSAQCRNDRPWGLVLPSNPGMKPPPPQGVHGLPSPILTMPPWQGLTFTGFTACESWRKNFGWSWRVFPARWECIKFY